MHFLFASEADTDVRRVTDSQFGVVQEIDGEYLLDLRTGQKAQIMRPVPLDFDFKQVETLSRRERTFSRCSATRGR